MSAKKAMVPLITVSPIIRFCNRIELMFCFVEYHKIMT